MIKEKFANIFALNILKNIFEGNKSNMREIKYYWENIYESDFRDIKVN